MVDDLPYGRFYYHNSQKIDSEYDYYMENILPELCTVSKTAPYITKWGYIDDAKDSCENPYRLNTSKVFDTCNFSANTFMQKGEIMEYTHSMPYYITNAENFNDEHKKNEYQYIPISNMPNVWKDSASIIAYFSQKKTEDGKDPFDAVFGDTSLTTEFTNKRFNKKYSRFLLGDKSIKASTLFRGVKFEITELNNGKEENTGKYNDYRFSFVYVPTTDDKVTKNVYFIKNDDYKFIVGVSFFNVGIKKLEDCEFNKVYVYAGCKGILKTKENLN
jgi:hypothetical protein